MKQCVALAGLVIVLGVALAAWGAPSAPPGGEAAAAAMYAPIEVTGVLTAAQELYREKDTIVFSALLRVETSSKEKPAVAEVISVKYPANVAQARAMGPGDEVQMSLHPKPEKKAGARVWTATGTPTVLGRGEFINPGQSPTQDLGSPQARVLVKMFAPMLTECHRETAKQLEELVKREPDRVRVQIFDMQTSAGRAEMQRERLQCATVLVNNRLYFTLSDGETERKVAFHHRPNTPQSTYRSEDVAAAVEQEIDRLY